MTTPLDVAQIFANARRRRLGLPEVAPSTPDRVSAVRGRGVDSGAAEVEPEHREVRRLDPADSNTPAARNGRAAEHRAAPTAQKAG